MCLGKRLTEPLLLPQGRVSLEFPGTVTKSWAVTRVVFKCLRGASHQNSTGPKPTRSRRCWAARCSGSGGSTQRPRGAAAVPEPFSCCGLLWVGAPGTSPLVVPEGGSPSPARRELGTQHPEHSHGSSLATQTESQQGPGGR